MKRFLLGSSALLASGLAHAVEKSDLSVVSLHTSMQIYFDFAQTNPALTIIGFATLALALGYRLRKQRINRS